MSAGWSTKTVPMSAGWSTKTVLMNTPVDYLTKEDAPKGSSSYFLPAMTECKSVVLNTKSRIMD
jgi:hypothetical protein